MIRQGIIAYLLYRTKLQTDKFTHNKLLAITNFKCKISCIYLFVNKTKLESVKSS